MQIFLGETKRNHSSRPYQSCLFCYYCCFYPNDFDILCLRLDDLFPVVSGLPHLEMEKLECQYRMLDPCAVHTPFLATSSLAHIKGGATHPSELDMYVCDLHNRSFSTQGTCSLKRHQESVHRQSTSFSSQVWSKHFYRKDHLGSRDLLGCLTDAIY